MECNAARLLMHVASPLRPTELDANEAEALKGHLRACPDCAALAQAARREERAIGQAMRAVPVPDRLRQRIRTRLDADRSTRRQRHFRRYAGAALMAASLLMALGLGVEAWNAGHRPTVQDEAVVATIGPLGNPSPENVQNFFLQNYGIRTEVPLEFDYGRLTYFDRTELQGQTVPMLLFTRGGEQARVYILSDRQFDLKAVLAAPPQVGSMCRIEVRPHPTDPRIAYLILYTSETLDPFTEKRPAA